MAEKVEVDDLVTGPLGGWQGLVVGVNGDVAEVCTGRGKPAPMLFCALHVVGTATDADKRRLQCKPLSYGQHLDEAMEDD